jgi:leader peptidase (prepilin peptidase)/N-methyltransferase
MDSVQLDDGVTTYFAVLLTVLGLLVGSFLNVVIARVPQGESVVTPRSRCPRCGSDVLARDNIPLLSWLILRARCRQCREPISCRYPLVELANAALWLSMLWRFGWSPELLAYLYFVSVGLALAVIDLDTKRLPNVLTLPSYAALGVLLAIPALTDGASSMYLTAWLAAFALFAFYLLLVLIYPAGMGLGDVKLAGVLGLVLGWLGWAELTVGAFLGFLLGALVGGTLMVVRRAGRKTKIPFGPFMIVGALLAILWGANLWDFYVQTLT